MIALKQIGFNQVIDLFKQGKHDEIYVLYKQNNDLVSIRFSNMKIKDVFEATYCDPTMGFFHVQLTEDG